MQPGDEIIIKLQAKKNIELRYSSYMMKSKKIEC